MAITTLAVICFALCSEVVASSESGVTRQQTDWQRDLFKNVSAVAAKLSRLAEPALLEKLDSSSFRAQLAACCPSASVLTARALLQRLQDEVAVVEVASGFDAAAPNGPIQADYPGMSIDDGLARSFFQNVWQDVLLHNETFTQSMQQTWKANFSFDERTVNWNEWSNTGCSGKALYATTYPLDICMMDSSQDQFSSHDGGIFRYSRHALNLTLESWSSRRQSWKSHLFRTGFPSLATPFLGNVSCPRRDPDYVINYTADDSCHSRTVWNASDMWGVQDDAEIHSYGLKPFGVRGAPRSMAEARSLLQYWEALPAGTIEYPTDVRFVIGSFRSLFGTAMGRKLQAWAKQRGWVLVWSLGLNSVTDINFIPYVIKSGLSFLLNQRLIDPEVLPHSSAVKGYPLPKHAKASFNVSWVKVDALRKIVPAPNDTAWAQQWYEVVHNQSQALQVEPLRSGVCTRPSDAPECIGISRTGVCLCYSASSANLGVLYV